MQNPKEGIRAALAVYGPRLLKGLVPLLVAAWVYFEGRSEFRGLKPEVAFHYISRLKSWKLAFLALTGLASILVMSGYDVLFKLGRARGKEGPGWGTILKTSWIANTTNNVMGFGGFTGAGIRLVFYKRAGVPVSELVRFLFLLSLSGLFGLSVLCGLALTGVLHVGSVYAEYPWLHLASMIMAFFWPVYLVLFSGLPLPFGKWFRSEERIGFKLAVCTALVSVLEWSLAGVTFYAAAAAIGIQATFAALLGIFALSATAGILSLAPGGAGTLDLVLLVALGTYGAQPEKALAALVLFRLCYYFIPWMIGLFLAAREWLPRREQLVERSQDLWGKTFQGWQRFWMWPGQSNMLGDFGIWALAALVFFAGSVLLFSAATPGVLNRMLVLHHWVTPLTMKWSQQITVILGLLLIVLSRGIRLKLRRAYRMTVGLLAAGAFFSLLKGLDYEEAIFLSAVAVLLYISRSRFYRHRWTYTRWMVLYWLIITACIAGGFYLLGDLTHPIPPGRWILKHKWAEAFFLKDRELFRSAVVGFAGSWIILTVWVWLSPKGTPHRAPSEEDLRRLDRLLSRYPGNPLTHLLYLGDKSFFWSRSGDVLIPYRPYRNVLVALGDPVGSEVGLKEALKEFRTFADQWAMTPVFYQVSPRHLTLYHEFGYRFFKLGEEGFVSVQDFTLTGRSKADLRAVRNRFEREGYRFEVVQQPLSEELLQELKGISDAWLEDRKEKGFSLGWFEPDYLNLAPVAVVRTEEGRAVAFASVMPCYDSFRTASVDLMRFTPDAGNGIMDYLFLRMFEWSKEQGAERFNMGMAPLSSVGEVPYALREERLANWVFRNANSWYRFKGIRRFKEKFDPVWETRYLAYPQGSSLVSVMLNVTLLISRMDPRERRASIARREVEPS